MTIKPKFTEVGTSIESASTAEAAVSQAIGATMSSLKDGVAQATASMEQAQTAMRQGVEKAIKSATDLFSFAQGNFEAFTKASQIFSAGLQDMTTSMAASSKASVDETMHTLKALSSVKSIKEAMDLQSALMRSTLEKAVAQTSKITEGSMKLSEQALAPINERLTLATEKFGRV
jgi:phasin family protein